MSDGQPPATDNDDRLKSTSQASIIIDNLVTLFKTVGEINAVEITSPNGSIINEFKLIRKYIDDTHKLTDIRQEQIPNKDELMKYYIIENNTNIKFQKNRYTTLITINFESKSRIVQ